MRVDVIDTVVAWQACSVVLRVVKSRGPLLQAGKLLYRLSKDSNNDALFRCVNASCAYADLQRFIIYKGGNRQPFMTGWWAFFAGFSQQQVNVWMSKRVDKRQVNVWMSRSVDE
jgi:hypothetical protein